MAPRFQNKALGLFCCLCSYPGEHALNPDTLFRASNGEFPGQGSENYRAQPGESSIKALCQLSGLRQEALLLHTEKPCHVSDSNGYQANSSAGNID